MADTLNSNGKLSVLDDENKLSEGQHQQLAKFAKSYNQDSFWKKLLNRSKGASKEVVYSALTLYYTARSDQTPTWCKTVILGTLGYFISIIDAIPDLTPVLGYSDDLALMIAAIATLTKHITPDIKSDARKKADALFGADKKEPQ